MSYAQVRRLERPRLTLIRGGLYGLGALGSDADLAAQAQIPVGVLRAIRSVESGAHANAVRFEPNLFIRQVPTATSSVPYTPARGQVDLTPAHTNRAAFEHARSINEQAAIRAASWGLYQVLGQHLLSVAPSNPVSTFDSDPAGTSDRMLVSWFAHNPAAAAAARAHNFSDLAYRYNGSRTSPWGARVAAAYARGGGEGAASALVTATAAVALPWLAAGSAGLIAIVVMNHYAQQRNRKKAA